MYVDRRSRRGRKVIAGTSASRVKRQYSAIVNRKLAVAVVFGHGVRAAPVHAAGHAAVGILVLREPLDVGAHGLRAGPARRSAAEISAPSRIHDRA